MHSHGVLPSSWVASPWTALILPAGKSLSGNVQMLMWEVKGDLDFSGGSTKPFLSTNLRLKSRSCKLSTIHQISGRS
jgi:hypothetical protein